ncbi:MAG TPA: family 78 glycoside hydrolase catalytic domain [Verrucomicrobiae bacterium]|nr:family 78 glycoside hydrolase catalytic domain [Verrucomicrobiae bacterium]
MRASLLTAFFLANVLLATCLRASPILTSEFINEHAPYPECHASTIAETAPGKLVAAWFGGTHERAPDVGIWVARQEDGHWLDAVEVGTGLQPDGTRFPTWNPVLFQPTNGLLVLFYKVGPSPGAWWGMMTRSADGGKTWDKPARLPEGILGPNKNKPVLLADGAWLCPSSTESAQTGWLVHFEMTRDAGRTWQSIGPVEKGNGLNAIQPTVLFHRDGRLQALCRTRNGVIASTTSSDSGKTWSPLSSTGLPNPNSGIDAVTLADGRQLLVYNQSAPPPDRPTKGVRYPLDVAISSDGLRWQHVLTLEDQPNPEGYAYPAVIQTSDGLVHITYTWHRQHIKHVVLDPSKLEPTPERSDAYGALRVVDLKCEYATDPMGIDTPNPRLFWKVASDERGQRQTAYQVLVASSSRILAEDRGDLWDSGRVASSDTTGIRYAGTPLGSSEQAVWKVRAWDRDGHATPWSAEASWTMGILKPEDWRGAWIVAPGATESLLLRHDFSVKNGLRRAVVHMCGLGQYELMIDGTKAGNDVLSPGWTDYDRTTLYDTLDVTAMLHGGSNTVGIILGNGMYNVVRRDRFVKFTGSFGALRAILHLRLEYTDGSVEFVGSDPTWRSHAGPITFNNIYGGEDCDERLEPVGWTMPGFDDHDWLRAVPLVRPGNTLRGESVSAEPLREIETRSPVATRSFPDGSIVYDLGQNASYMPRIRLSGPAGSAVRLTPAEVVNPDGTINRSTMGGVSRGSSWWQYTKSTDGEETWSPKFCYVGCRYLKAEFFSANPGKTLPHIESIEGVVVHSSAAPVGQFAASNPLLNRIRDLVRWAQRSNMVSILTDCPHREKLAWLEQYHLNGPSIRYEFDATRIFAKGVHDMADAQDDSGLIPTTAPEYAKFKGTFRAATEWGSAFIIVPWQQYMFTGDREPLGNHFGAMKKYFAYLETRATNDIVSEGLGDWYDLGPKKPGVAQLTPPPVTATAFYFYDATILARAAGLLGRSEDAAHYAARAEQIRASYNRRFFNRDTGSYATGSQCANALALVMNIVDPSQRQRVLAALVRDVEQHDGMMTTGDIGFRYLLQALADGGRSDLVYRMINRDDKPGYGFQLKKGETSLTESWDANLSSSHNHFMLGQIIEWFYKDLAGIDCDPAGPGFQKIILRPEPVGDLTWVEASYESVHGPIWVRWERHDDRFVLSARIPANTTATVFLPSRRGAEVLESGTPASRQHGVTCIRQDGERAVYAIESGSYRFESRFEQL